MTELFYWIRMDEVIFWAIFWLCIRLTIDMALRDHLKDIDAAKTTHRASSEKAPLDPRKWSRSDWLRFCCLEAPIGIALGVFVAWCLNLVISGSR